MGRGGDRWSRGLYRRGDVRSRAVRRVRVFGVERRPSRRRRLRPRRGRVRARVLEAVWAGGEGGAPDPGSSTPPSTRPRLRRSSNRARGSCLQRSCPAASRRTSSPTSSRSAGRKLQSVEIEARIVRLRLAETFVIARDATDHADVVHVALSHEEMTGYGEAAPVERYDSPRSPRAFIEEHTDLVGDDPFALEEIGERLAVRPGGQAAKSAIDAALHDLGESCSEFPRIASSGFRGTARRPRGPCGSAIRTTWRGEPRRRHRATG